MEIINPIKGSPDINRRTKKCNQLPKSVMNGNRDVSK